jgi:hypothetical protein
MCEYDSYDNDDSWCGANYDPDNDYSELYDPSVDYRLCDCSCTEDEAGESVWITCGICCLLQKHHTVASFPKEVAYIQTAIARFQGTQNAEHRTYIARALLRYCVNEAADLLASSLICRDLVRAKCDELEEGTLGSTLVVEIAAARAAVEQKEINAFKLIL